MTCMGRSAVCEVRCELFLIRCVCAEFAVCSLAIIEFCFYAFAKSVVPALFLHSTSETIFEFEDLRMPIFFCRVHNVYWWLQTSLQLGLRSGRV